MEILNVKDLVVDFELPHGTVRALDGASLSVPRGKTVALVGESGSGKSVLCQAVMGILPRAAKIGGGGINFTDPQGEGPAIDLAKISPTSPVFRNLRGARAAMIFQEPMTALSPLHTIADQIGEVWMLHGDGPKSEARARARDILARVGFPDPDAALDKYPFELSGGMRQRAVIAMALVCEPALLIADEPTTALDVTIQAQILKLIVDLQSDFNMGVLFITHDLGVVANVADEVVVLYRGQVMEAGAASELMTAPRHDYLKALMGAVPRMGMAVGERLTPLRQISSRIETWGDEVVPTPADETYPLLEVRGISKQFAARKSGFLSSTTKWTTAINDVSFTLARGECLGLVGESGSGKSTTAKAVVRAFAPTKGTVFWCHDGVQHDVCALKGDLLNRFRRKVQYIFQDPMASLNPRMTVFEILSEPMEVHDLCGLAERRTRVAHLLDLVGLDPECARRYPHAFSGGQRQRIGIARALALEPDVLILDEPVSALDVSVQAQVLNLLKDLKSALGLTYLFVSHNLAVVDYIADDVLVMAAGRIVERGPKRALFENPQHPYTRALMNAIPLPDVNHKLDLGKIMAGRASNPAAWPEEFRLVGDAPSIMLECGPGHFVAKPATGSASQSTSETATA